MDMFWPMINVLNREFGDFGRIAEELENRFYSGGEEETTPALNVYGNENELVVSAELPGADPDDIKVTVADKVLTLEAERKPVNLGEEDAFLHRERRYGSVKRSLRLPFAVRDNDIKAAYRDGVLTITLPRVEEDKPRVIKVNAS
jgi:HSP20 family protein